jgi:hypothetical protein
MAQGCYQRGISDLLGAGDFLAGTIVGLLVEAGYVFNPDHDYLSDITNEINESGYARQTLASKTVSVDDTNNRVIVDAADPVYTAVVAGGTATQHIVARSTGVDSTSPLIAQYDITSTPTNGGNITINYDSVGMFVVNC